MPSTAAPIRCALAVTAAGSTNWSRYRRYNSWQWEGPFTLNVSSTGVHTLGISRRESLTQVDKLFIGTSSNATPTGTGPEESLR